MSKHLLERSRPSQRSKQTKNQPNIDLRGFFEDDISKHRLKILTEKRGLSPDEESYRNYVSRLSKIERAKMVTSLMVIQLGDAELLNISEIARRSGLTRPALHAIFGEKGKESATRSIYLFIFSDLAQTVQSRLGNLFTLFASKDPMELLMHLFQAIQFAVNEKPEYAIVSFQEVSLANEDEMRIVAPAYDMAIKLYGSARERGFTNENAHVFGDHQVIHSLFYVVRSAILAQFGEGKPPDKGEFLSEDAAYIQALMGLKMYASNDAARLIEKKIKEAREKLKASL